MSDEPAAAGKIESIIQREPGVGIVRLPGGPPPPPATFDFAIASMTVKNPRSLLDDTDYATLSINVLAADGTVLKQYGPVSDQLGNLSKGQTINPSIALTGLAIPDGGSIAVAFVVLNKGGWDWDSKAFDALGLVGAGVLGALAQGGILGAPVITQAATETTAAVVTTTAPVSIPFALAVGAAIVAVLEGISILFADCDGTVVPGVMTIGKTELLQFAAPGPWKIVTDYPGADSPVGCGANSDYSVTYSVEATPPHVAVPELKGLTIEAGLKALGAAGLVGLERVIDSGLQPSTFIVGQSPAAGVSVVVGSLVTYDIDKPSHGHLPQ